MQTPNSKAMALLFIVAIILLLIALMPRRSGAPGEERDSYGQSGIGSLLPSPDGD